MEQEQVKVYKMKWFKFIIYVQLFFNAVIFVIQGIQYITGGIYGVAAPFVYALYGQGLKLLDMLFGVVCIVFAVAAIWLRMRLAGFKKKAPLYYLLYIGIQGVVSVGYSLAVAAITNQFTIGTFAPLLGTIFGSLMSLVINYLYFDKRKELFVN